MKTLSIEPSDDRTFCQKRWISHLHKTIGIEDTKTCEDIIDAVSRHLSEAQMAHYRKKYENGDADMFLSPLSWLRADHIDHIKDKAKGLLDSLLRTGNVSLIDLLHELELESRDTEEVARLLELAGFEVHVGIDARFLVNGRFVYMPSDAKTIPEQESMT